MTAASVEAAGKHAYEPVDLDQPDVPPPPSAELARWQELAEPQPYICHEGDASRVMPMPRPVWAAEDSDYVGESLLMSYYRSEIARIPVSQSRGFLCDGDDGWEQASVNVSVKLFGNGVIVIPLSLRTRRSSCATGGWQVASVSLTPDEAAKLAEVITAAVELAKAPDAPA